MMVQLLPVLEVMVKLFLETLLIEIYNGLILKHASILKTKLQSMTAFMK